MACIDIEMCEKIDTMNTNLETLISQQQNYETLFSGIDNKLNNIGFWVYLIIIGFAVYLIVRWIFRLFSNLALGW
jgi:hypothetical protein